LAGFITLHFLTESLVRSSRTGNGRVVARDEYDSMGIILVWVLSTGGTISGKGASSTSLAEYKSGSLLGEELVKAVPEIQLYADVKVEQIVNVSSSDITLDGSVATLKEQALKGSVGHRITSQSGTVLR
jgi:L-asparaginase/Glu-tRNA(Gln) amidotransferase subunit D